MRRHFISAGILCDMVEVPTVTEPLLLAIAAEVGLYFRDRVNRVMESRLLALSGGILPDEAEFIRRARCIENKHGAEVVWTYTWDGAAFLNVVSGPGGGLVTEF